MVATLPAFAQRNVHAAGTDSTMYLTTTRIKVAIFVPVLYLAIAAGMAAFGSADFLKKPTVGGVVRPLVSRHCCPRAVTPKVLFDKSNIIDVDIDLVRVGLFAAPICPIECPH